ncbi:uncharacterized membrane protein YsdA (DUF1294 family) [Arthrobacter psychrochitiniphilus]|nr:uncharacterized membrane protein YsdA (DUF1294 family) [Arthrobacter psychrochitiniphilus]
MRIPSAVLALVAGLAGGWPGSALARWLFDGTCGQSSHKVLLQEQEADHDGN